MKSQLARLQQTLTVQSELIYSMVQEMILIRQEAAMHRHMSELMLSMIFSGEDSFKPLIDEPTPSSQPSGYWGLDPSRLP
jgi:hypothetical protein